MKTSANGRALIEAFEGLYLKAYQDSVGVWTIGYGHTSAAGGPQVSPGMKITEEEADKFLSDDLTRVEYDVCKYIQVDLNQNEFDALVSFHFNTGKLKSGSIDDKINAGDKRAAMETLLQYDHAGGQQLRGLTRRRQAEKMLFEGDVAGALRLAGSKKPIINSETVTHTTTIATTTAAITHWPNLWPYIIGAGVAALVISWVIFRIRERNKNV
jgi:lysozyme